MPIVADAAVAIRGDLSKFPADLKKADGPVQALGQRIQSSLSPKALFGGIATGLAGVFAASKVGEFIGASIKAASDLGETVSKVGAIFGKEAIPELEKWAATAADAFGQSKQQALDAASTFAIFGKSAGLAGNDLIGFSQELTVLSSDLASFFNTSPEDAVLAIGAALRGESEPIRRYGVLLDEATLRQRAMKLGIIETTTQALTPQQRVLAAQAEILAQTSDAQGDFTRTSDGLANQQRILEANLHDVSVEIGQKMLPVMVELAHFANETLIPALESVVDNVGAIVRGAQRIAATPGGVADWWRNLFGLSPQDNRDMEALIQQVVHRNFGAASAAVDAETGRWTGNTRSFIDETATTLAGGAPKITDGAQKGLVEPLLQAVIDARVAARKEAELIPGAISEGFIKKQHDLDDGLTALKDLMANSLSDVEKIAHDKAILADPAIAAALVDERFDVRDAAQKVVDAATTELANLESGAYDAAVDAGVTLEEQLRLNEDGISKATADMMRGAKDYLETLDWTINGPTIQPPKYGGRQATEPGVPSAPTPTFPPTSGQLPIRNLQSGAWEIPRNEMFNLHAGEMVVPPDAARALRAWFGEGSGSSAGVVNNSWILNVNGVPLTFGSRDDFIKALDSLSSFNVGRTNG